MLNICFESHLIAEFRTWSGRFPESLSNGAGRADVGGSDTTYELSSSPSKTISWRTSSLPMLGERSVGGVGWQFQRPLLVGNESYKSLRAVRAFCPTISRRKRARSSNDCSRLPFLLARPASTVHTSGFPIWGIPAADLRYAERKSGVGPLLSHHTSLQLRWPLGLPAEFWDSLRPSSVS